MARIDLPCTPGSASQLLPPSCERNTSPACWFYYAPGRNVNVFGILRIDGDVIENIVVAAQVGQARPVVSPVRGQEKRSGAGPKIDAVGILRVVSQAPHVASVRTQRGPLTGPESDVTDSVSNSQCNQ